MSRLPQLRPVEVMNALKRAGFIPHHQTGSHRFFYNPHTRQLTQVAIHARDIKRGTLMKILRQAGLSQDEFRRLL